MGDAVKFFSVRQKGNHTLYLTPGCTWTSWFAGAIVLPETMAHRFELPPDGELFEFTPGDIVESTSYSEVRISPSRHVVSAPASGPNRQQRRQARAQKRRQQKGLS